MPKTVEETWLELIKIYYSRWRKKLNRWRIRKSEKVMLGDSDAVAIKSRRITLTGHVRRGKKRNIRQVINLDTGVQNTT